LIPQSYVRTVQGYVNMPLAYANMARGWSGVTENYFEGHARAREREQNQIKLKPSDKVGVQRLAIKGAFWEASRGQAKPAGAAP